MNKTPILSLLFALSSVTLTCPLLTSCDDDESKVFILEKEIEAGLLADNSVVTDTTCVSATIQGKMLHEEKLNDMFNYSNVEMGIEYIKEEDFIANKDGYIYWTKHFSEEATFSNFKIQLKYLEPSTNYLYRVYFVAGNTTLFGEAKQFTTQSADRYLSLEVVEQDFHSMKFAGINRLDGISGEITEDGIMMRYYERDNYYKDVPLTRKGDSLFLSLTDELSAGRTYKYYVKAHGGGRSVCTSLKTFSTRNPADYIYLNEPVTTSTSAVISGQVDTLIFTNYNSDRTNLTDVYYGTDINKLNDWAYIWATDEKFEIELKYLQPATTYYYKVGASYYYDHLPEGFHTEIRSFTTKQ